MLTDSESSAFSGLSLLDLLEARDQFHIHLMKKENVIGTAVGRYLIRKSDPYPPATSPAGKRSARTLENSEVRDYSWPCVLVFVSDWADDNHFGKSLDMGSYIPKAIYLPDGRSVPICVVHAPQSQSAATTTSIESTEENLQSGGISVYTDVQGVLRRATLGCLVSDGHKIYGLSNRHVCGDPGTPITALTNGQQERIGVSSAKQLGRRLFGDVYQGWPGKNVFVQLDVGLIELDSIRDWESTVQGIGKLGPLADLGTHNLSLKLIDTHVRAYGSVGGSWQGKISALFYRFKSVAGFEYVADFLIGSRDATPIHTVPGDSGTIIVVESSEERFDRMPIGLQWGGAVFSAEGGPHPFALATNLSTICRDLELEIYRGQDGITFEYWGPTGHYSVGGFACDLPSNAHLKTLMSVNRNNIGFDSSGSLAGSTSFHALADVPDTVWKNQPRKSREAPSHYADMDLPNNSGKTLYDLTPTADSLAPVTWISFYNGIGWNKPSQRGFLPFRVWQIYKKMVEFVQAQNVTQFVAAAGILAHYVGDASQPLHGSMFDDGDPHRKPDGTPSSIFLGHGKAFAHGVHSAYESKMLDHNRAAFQNKLSAAIPAAHNMATIDGGQAAGFAVIELMRRTRNRIKPFDIVTLYGSLVLSGHTNQASSKLWEAFGDKTVECIVDSCRTLAMLWESAWIEGNGDVIPSDKLKKIQESALASLYNATSPEFLKSALLNDIANEL